jgi:hypothetical protein
MNDDLTILKEASKVLTNHLNKSCPTHSEKILITLVTLDMYIKEYEETINFRAQQLKDIIDKSGILNFPFMDLIEFEKNE